MTDNDIFILSAALLIAAEDIQKNNKQYTAMDIYSHYISVAKQRLLEALEINGRQDN